MNTSKGLQAATVNDTAAIALRHQPIALPTQKEFSRKKQRSLNHRQWLEMASQAEFWSLVVTIVMAVVSRQLMLALPLSVGFGLNLVNRQRIEQQMQQRFDRVMTEVAQVQRSLQNQSNPSSAIEVSELEQRVETLEKADWQQPIIALQEWVSDLDVSAEALHDRTRIVEWLQQQMAELQQLMPRQSQNCRAIFIDGTALYHKVKKMGIKIDYAKLLAKLSGDASSFQAIFYAAVEEGHHQQGFLAYLRQVGYRVVTKNVVHRGDGSSKCDFGAYIAADLLNLVGKYDTAVLVSDNDELAAALKAVSDKGARVEVVSLRSKISDDDLFDVADSYVDLETIQDEVCCV